MSKLGEGVIPAMVTLFKSDKSVDEEGLRKQVDFLIDGGVHGIIVLGSLGEFMLVEKEERKKIAEITVEQADGRVPIYIGTASTCTDEVIELTEHAKDIGSDAVTIVTPYYFKLSDRALYEHYSSVAQEVDIPIILYHFPGATGQDLKPEVVSKLAHEHENIVGLKPTIDSVKYMQQVLKLTRDLDFKVIAGAEDHALSILTLGGHGFVSGVANFAPESVVPIYENYVGGNIEEAITKYWELVEIRKLWEINAPAPVFIKYAMSFRGMPMDPATRQPHLPLTDEQQDKVKQVLEETGLRE